MSTEKVHGDNKEAELLGKTKKALATTVPKKKSEKTEPIVVVTEQMRREAEALERGYKAIGAVFDPEHPDHRDWTE